MALTGYLALVLHAHLPFVRHPEYPEFLEEDWLFEAITETYLPLIALLRRLTGEGLPWRLTMSLTPPLCEMLTDALLQARYVRHLDKLIALCEAECERLLETENHATAVHYLKELRERRTLYLAIDRNPVAAFRSLQEAGGLEIVTCTATHGFLPLLEHPEAIRAQLIVAVQNYEKHFGIRPRGIWLAECGYRPGIEAYLAEVGLRFFFVDTHGVTHATPAPVFGVAAPLLCPNGVAAFARDPETSAQVWSATTGYPANPIYREFYRDVGWDAPLEYLRPFLHADGFRRNLGIKYHRITGPVPLHEKEAYGVAEASELARRHAADFLFRREDQLTRLALELGRPPLIVSPYDAELFGHWWYEGPQFIEAFLRLALTRRSPLRLTTPAEYLERHPEQQVAQPAQSTWGRNGFAEMWLNAENAWIQPLMLAAETRLVDTIARSPHPTPFEERVLRQAGRELLLLQSSDWAFIITNQTTVAYAEKRVKEHFSRLMKLLDDLGNDCVDEAWLSEIEQRDNLFPELDIRAWSYQAGWKR